MVDAPEITARLARNVRNAREAADLSQEQLGELIGVRRNEVNSWENARRRISERHLLAVARVLEQGPGLVLHQPRTQRGRGGMTVLIIAAVVLALVAAVALAIGPLPARRVPPARPRRREIVNGALNGVGDDADHIWR